MEMEVLTPYARAVKLIEANPSLWSWEELIGIGFISVLMGVSEKPKITEWEIESHGMAILGSTPIPSRIYEILLRMIDNEQGQ